MPEDSIIIGAALLAGIATAASVWALAGPRFARPDPLTRRLERFEPAAKGARGRSGSQARGRQRSIRSMLREIEEVQKRRGRASLRLRLRQAGLGWSKAHYFAVCASIGIVVLGLGLILGLGLPIAAGFALATAIGLPQFALRSLRLRRQRKMADEFPNAVDVIVRGVKSGLPLGDCLRIIAAESREPLRSEFAKIVRDQAVGLPVDEAVDRFAQRVPTSEANFFSIVIAIQSRTGGSLSESLSNLSTVLRERRKMRGKVKAFSAEAKASAGIIGSLPVVVSAVIYVTSPDYMGILFETLPGKLVIAGSAVWMMIGVLVMRRMINFEI